jgi:isocitrate dehydrogenase kinase/phosphatase
MNKRSEYLTGRMRKVRRLIELYYEPGNQKKCKKQVYRKYIAELYPMSERTFWRYIKDMKREKI